MSESTCAHLLEVKKLEADTAIKMRQLELKGRRVKQICVLSNFGTPLSSVSAVTFDRKSDDESYFESFVLLLF